MKKEAERFIEKIYKRRKRQFWQDFKKIIQKAHDLGLVEIRDDLDELRDKVRGKCFELPKDSKMRNINLKNKMAEEEAEAEEKEEEAEAEEETEEEQE